jgi:PAS domain S-box-containing protein
VLLLLERWKRKRSRAELVRANTQLRLAMESGNPVGWEWDLVRDELTWFGNLRTVFGIDSETFAGTIGDFSRLSHPEDRERVAEELEDARQNHKPYSSEFRVVRTDGSIRGLNATGSFEYAQNGKAKRVVGMAVDIPERRQVEEALKKSETSFSKAFHESPLPVTLTSALDYHYIEVNEAFERLTGWSAEEVVGRNPFEMGTWVDPAQVEDFEKRLRAEGSVRNAEVTIRRKDGAIRSVLKSAELLEISGQPCVVFVASDITDRKQIEQSLRDNQNRLENIVQSLTDAMIAVNDETRIVLFNTAAEKMFAVPALDALGTPIERFILERFRDVHVGHIRRYAETDATNWTLGDLGTLWAIRANGEEFPIKASISQVTIGGKRFFTAMVRDISERIKTDELQRRLAAIVYSSEDAILSLSLDGIIESWNPAAQRMYGYSEDEALGQSVMMLVPTALREEETDILRRLSEGDAIERYETARITKEGRRLDVSVSLAPIRHSNGKIVGLSEIARDITAQKHAQQSLRESEERFRLVANTVPVMIWMSAPDKLRTYVNEPWLAFTGRSREQELKSSWAEGVHPDDLKDCWKTYEASFDKREPFQMEYRLRRHDGEYRWVFDRGAPRFSPDGSFAGYIGCCTDITERRVVQDLLSRMSRRLLEAHEEERTWIARELHDDINQKIALIAVNLDRLKQELSPPSATINKQFEDVCAHVADLGTDVETLSHRLHSSKLEYLGISSAASSFCRELAEKHQVQIDFRSKAVPAELPNDIALCLYRVLQEALHNAMKHSGTRHFEVSLSARPNAIELTVRDWGIGFRFEHAMQKTGLGLINMIERLKLLGGDLSIDSPRGGGTLVRAIVPFVISRKAAGT